MKNSFSRRTEVARLVTSREVETFESEHPEEFSGRKWVPVVCAKVIDTIHPEDPCTPYNEHEFFLGWIPEDGVKLVPGMVIGETEELKIYNPDGKNFEVKKSHFGKDLVWHF